MWFGIGGIIGWPFATALVMPFIAEELILASLTREGIEVFRRFLDGTVRSLLALVRSHFHVPRSAVLHSLTENTGPAGGG